MRYPALFIGVALICLLTGESFGIWMSQNPERFSLAGAHAHLNLAGWVTLCLYGLTHQAFPALSKTKLAPVQCALAILGALVMAPGILIAITSGDTNIAFAVAGSLGVLLGTLLFAIMFFGTVVFRKASP